MLRSYVESPHASHPAPEVLHALANELHVSVGLLRERLQACAPGVLLQATFTVGRCERPEHIVLIGDAGCTAFVQRHGDGIRMMFGRMYGRVCDGLQVPTTVDNQAFPPPAQVNISLAERAQK